MAIKGTKGIASAVHWAIAEMQAAYPDDGFIVIALKSTSDGALATLASSIDSEATSAVLADLSEYEVDEPFALPHGRHYN